MENLAAMAIFARVVEAGSFTGAARRLGMSKSAVSKQLSGLEEVLGVRLLNRTTRKLSLSQAGLVFHEHCARMLTEAQAALEAVQSLQSEPRGLLRVNAPMSFGIIHLAPAIPDFLARHPGLRVDMDLSDRYVDLVSEGFDLAIRIGRLEDSSLIARRIAPARRVVCGAPAYFARHGLPREPADLARHNCLLYAYLRSHDEWRFRHRDDGEEIAVRVDGNFRANNGDALVGACLRGLGLSLSPTFLVADALREGRLVACLTDWPDIDSSIQAIYPHRRNVTARVRAFIDFCIERFADAPWEQRG